MLSAMPAFEFEFPGDVTEAPEEFRMFRAGVNKTDKGDFLFDEEAAAAVMTSYASEGKQLMADYEHQSLVQPAIEAPASVKSFVPQVRNGELWATAVKWTERARAYLAAGEYRFFSPAFIHDEKSGRISKLINFALTNNPATHALEPLVAASANSIEGDDTMTECTACTALSKQLAAKDEELKSLTARLTALESSDKEKAAEMSALTVLRSGLYAATGKATDAEASGVLQALKSSHEKLAVLEGQLETEKATRLTAEFATVLDQAGKDGKIPPAQRPFWEGQAKDLGVEKGLVMLKAFTAVASTVVKTTETPGAAVALGLTPDQIKIAKLTGSNPEAVAKHNARRLAERASQ